jgi:hypothetical protein
MGHHLAEQQEDHPWNIGRDAPGECGGSGAAGLPGLADEFLFVRAYVVLHGGRVALWEHGDIREVGA